MSPTPLERISELRRMMLERTEFAIDCMRTQRETQAAELLRQAAVIADAAGGVREEWNEHAKLR